VSTTEPDEELVALAASEGLTEVGLFDGGPYSLSLAYSPDADLDGAFPAICLDTGERLKIQGWLFTHEALG